MTLAPGLHFGIPADAYHADALTPRPSLSSTLGRILLNRSPRHAWTAHPRLNPNWQPTTRKVFDIGRAAHREILGAGGGYAVIPDAVLSKNGAASTNAAKEFIASCRDAGVTPISAEEADLVQRMAAVARQRLAEMRITLDPARSEVVALAEIDGCPVRAMLDNMPERGPIYDFKTTEDASPDGALRAIVNYGLDFQGCHYIDTVQAATGERRGFRFIFQEKAEPFELSVVELYDNPADDADWMLDARHKAAEARRIWSECIATGRWPGYPPMVATLGAPSYHRQKWAARPVQAAVPQSTIARVTAWQSIGAKT